MRDDKPADFRKRYRPYIMAAVVAFVMTIFIAPEMHEGDAMEPIIKNGQVIVLNKETYSIKRGLPEAGSIVVLKKGVFPESAEDNPIRRVAGLPGETVMAGDMTVTLGEDEVLVVCENGAVMAGGDGKEFGQVKLKDIRGLAMWIVWPLSDIGRIEQ